MSSESDRTLINLKGYCLYCLKRIGNDSDLGYQSPTCTPIPPSPLSTPLRTRYQNVHSLPLQERLAPFTDLCRYLGVDLPDCYAFGDGSEPEVLYPPLCEKCHELSARLCFLQDEFQYIQTRINNTVERIHKRVASTCDKRGAIKREEFNKEFKRKSKGSLSRGRGENPEGKRVTALLKRFQMSIVVKEHENREKRRRRETNILFPAECRHSLPPEMHIPNSITPNDQDGMEQMENEENIKPEPDCDELCLTRQEYLPLEETLRSSGPSKYNENGSHCVEVENVHVQVEANKPYPDISTILFENQNSQINSSSKHRRSLDLHDDESSNNDMSDDDYHLKSTMVVGVTTRSQARRQLNADVCPE